MVWVVRVDRPVPTVRVSVESATGRGNAPAERDRIGRTFRFGSGTVQKLDPLLLGGPNPAPYASSRGLPLVWLDPSGPISNSAFCVFLFMVAFRYPTVNSKSLTKVLHCHFLLY